MGAGRSESVSVSAVGTAGITITWSPQLACAGRDVNEKTTTSARTAPNNERLDSVSTHMTLNNGAAVRSGFPNIKRLDELDDPTFS